MSEQLATIIMTGLVIAASAGGVTYGLLMLYHQRTLLAGVRMGWFVVLFGLISVVFFLQEMLAGARWVYPAGVTVGAAIFVARDFARRSDLMVLLVLDLVFGVALLATVAAVIGPESGIPLLSLVPIIVLAAVAWGAHLFRRLYLDRGNTAGAARARLVKLWALGLMPVFLFGGLIVAPPPVPPPGG